ncbi:methyl-accepting chemotaxis protein [Aliivibrio sifiae]|uniref:Methyl-accepting chemotaxis protein n=1 Tax=Aliivibrio sifiae TaxID=566293 RepID=A0A2S7X729_9GAMM|nr:methyl-accepting chemotaxis protein [Aliivibrio sifiae]PQJ87129.1 methyl-accepting chemotaxis protein [Aliivibrio sifiae]GLR73737.1 methyl-accepting chemotaxis protein [Aliivibrio sifiae]
MLQKSLINLKTKYQILVPVLATIIVMMIAIFLVNEKLESTNRNVQISEHRSTQLSNVSVAESRLLFLRLSVSASFTDLGLLKTIDFDGISSELRSNFTSMVEQQRILQELGAAAKSPDVLQQEVDEILSQINEYKKLANNIVQNNDTKVEEWGNSIYLTTPIQQASELISASSVSEEAKAYWDKVLPEVYNSAGSIEIQMTSLFNEDLYTSVSKSSRIDIVNREFETLANLIAPLEHDGAKKVMADAFKSQSDMNAILWDATTSINQYKQEMVKLGSNIYEELNKEKERLSSMNQKISLMNMNLISESQNLLFISIAVTVIVSLIIGVIIAQIVTKPILILQEQMSDISNGRLDSLNNQSNENEIGELCKNTDSTVIRLQEMISSLRNVGEEVSSSSTELAAIMVQSEANASDQKSQVDLIAAAITELAASANQVDESANQADMKAREVLGMSRDGAKSASEGVKLSKDLAVQMDGTSSEVMILKDQTDRISEVITVIDSISEQTNLLALNAAIEAARAGESGRGFAVVADEVRVLAAKTQQSTQNIQNIINDLQQKSLNVVDAVNQSIEMIHKTAQMSIDTNNQLLNISDSIESISQTNSEMATAANEQNRAIESISENVNVITESINQNVEGIRESTQASQHLSELSENQREQLLFFKL